MYVCMYVLYVCIYMLYIQSNRYEDDGAIYIYIYITLLVLQGKHVYVHLSLVFDWFSGLVGGEKVMVGGWDPGE